VHAILQILIFWVFAFVSLCATIVLLNLFWDLIEQDLALHELGREMIIAGVASFVEASGLWLILRFTHGLPPNATTGALVVPGFIVGLIYKINHLEDWSHYEIIGLLFFQLIIALVGAGLLTGHFAMATTVAIIFAIVLAVIASFVRGL
jgi:hypothetical protein